MARRYEIDMTKGSVLKSVFRFAIPVMFTHMLQMVYHMADLITVGRFAGADAMASVGATSGVNAMLLNLFIGLSAGSCVLASRRFGARDNDSLHRVIHTSMALAIITGVIGLILSQVLTKTVLEYMGTPEGTVLEGATIYLRIIFLGTPAILVYNFSAAIIQGLGDTKTPFYILAVTGIINVVFNLIFVIVFKLGVAGVAYSTIMANYLSAVAVVIYLMRADASYRLKIKKLKLYRDELIDIIKIGLPTGFQGMVAGFANSTIQSGVNSFGGAAVAGSAAAEAIEDFIYRAMFGFAQGAVTGVSQNYGAQNKERIKKFIYVPMMCAVTVGIVLAAIALSFARPLLSIYITDSPVAMEFGVIRMKIVISLYFIIGIMEVLSGTLKGLGHTGIIFFNYAVGYCCTSVGWIILILPLKRIPEVLFLCCPIAWMVVIIFNIAALLMVWKKTMRKMLDA